MGIGTRMLILARSSKHCRQFKRICCIPCKLIYFPKISFPGPLAGSCVYFTTPKKFSRNCHAVYGLAGRFHYTLLFYFFFFVYRTGTQSHETAGYRACRCLVNFYRFDRFGPCTACPDHGLDCKNDTGILAPNYFWKWSSQSIENYTITTRTSPHLKDHCQSH